MLVPQSLNSWSKPEYDMSVMCMDCEHHGLLGFLICMFIGWVGLVIP